MIILEGPDGAGKSTLLGKLEMGLAEYGIHAGVHAGTPNRDRMWETTVPRTYDAIAADLNPDNPPLVWDRLFYSELVYSPVMKRPNAFGTRSNYVHRLIAYTQSPVIFCMPPFDIVQQNVFQTEQHDWVTDNVEAIYKRYQQITARYHTSNTYLWDYTHTTDWGLSLSWPQLVNHLRDYINKRRTVV